MSAGKMVTYDQLMLALMKALVHLGDWSAMIRFRSGFFEHFLCSPLYDSCPVVDGDGRSTFVTF